MIETSLASLRSLLLLLLQIVFVQKSFEPVTLRRYLCTDAASQEKGLDHALTKDSEEAQALIRGKEAIADDDDRLTITNTTYASVIVVHTLH